MNRVQHHIATLTSNGMHVMFIAHNTSMAEQTEIIDLDNCRLTIGFGSFTSFRPCDVMIMATLHALRRGFSSMILGIFVFPNKNARLIFQPPVEGCAGYGPTKKFFYMFFYTCSLSRGNASTCGMVWSTFE